MATITVPSDPTLPVAGAEIKAAPLKDWITNIRTFLEATNIDEANVDTAGADGIVGKSIDQTITGLKTFSNTAAAAGGLREVAKFEINPASGTAAANDGLRMTFTADDAGGNATAVGYVDLKLTDASATSEDSEWRFSTISNASSVTPLVVNATSITMTTGTVAIGTNATIGGGLTVTGTGIFGALTVGSAAISEAELEMLDGLTGGTVTASKAVVVDGNKDIASFRNVTLTGELDAATLDISGDADIDGTLEADAITLGGTALGSLYSPIAGSSSIVTVGTVGTGTWQGSVIASAYLDADTAHLSGSQTFTGDKAFTGTVTVGVDGTGKDVTFYGDTSGSKVVWDESADDLVFTNAGIAVGSDATGDIYYRNSSGFLARLASGADGTVLTGTGAGAVPAWESPTTGDITSVVAGVGLSGGGTSGDVTLTLDISELSTVTPADGDFFATLDSDGANEQKTTTTALATLFAGAGMTASSSVLNVIGGDGITANANDVAITAAQTTITSVINASLALGRDADNQIKFGTDDQIVFEVAGGDGVTFKASGEIEATTLDISGDADIDGTLEADAITLGGTALGSIYSPIAGSSSITTVGTIGTGTWQGTAIASAYLDSDTAHLSTTQTFTGDKTFTGTLTVGADDTGKDVKFFGASAGAYMEWDESADQLRIVGASADATTSTGKLLLATSLNDINANDVIGKIEFQAPLEVGADAISVSASIKAVAQSTFTASSNATDIIFSTGHSETATEKFRITSQGELGIGGTNYGSDGQVLTSGGAGAAPAWEDASSGGHTIQEEGSSLTQRTNLNFVGAGVTATDDSGNNATKVTVTPTGASLPVTRSDGSTSDPIALTSAALGESLVSDTSPQLGGDLDVNGQSIVSDASNENIPITPHGTGSVVISKLSVTGDTSLDGGSFVFNESGADKDFRIEGDSQANLFVADASTDRIGIGTATPAAPLEVIVAPGNGVRITDPSGSADASESTIGFYGSTDGGTRLGWVGFGGTSNSVMSLSNDQSDAMTFATGGTEALRINNEGVLGIKTTPASGWHTDHGVLQIGTGAFWVDPHDEASANNMVFLSNNLYRDSADEWRAIVTDEVTRYYQYGGVHYFDTAASTSAGAAISWSSNRLLVDGNGAKIGDSANANMTLGLTINQAANDNEALSLKSSDVAHGATNYTETDTYFYASKRSAAQGGARLFGFADGAGMAVDLHGLAPTPDTSDTSTSNAVVRIGAYKTDGSSAQQVADGENMFCIHNADAVCRLVLKGSGSMHIANTTLSGLDKEDDIGLVRAFQKASSKGVGIVMSKWDEVMKENEEDLRRVGVLSSESDFVIQQNFNSLIGGSVWQLYTKLQETKEFYEDKIAALESRLLRLEA